MNINPENKDALSGSLFTGGNSPPANPVGYNGSPLAASKMESRHVEILKAIHTGTHSLVRTARLGQNHQCLILLYQVRVAVENAIAELEKLMS
jgi:hypothetical protein